jgi:hypothetical protein
MPNKQPIQPTLFDYFPRSEKMKFNDHKIITALIYEIGFLNDQIILGDISHIKFGLKFAQRKIDQAKKDLAKEGITDCFFMTSEFGGMIALSYEYKFDDGFSVKCSRITPTGQLRK